MSRLNDLIRQLRSKDPALANDIELEVAALADRRAFGLNFERHVPEAVELPDRRVRRGDKVRIVPPCEASTTKAGDRLGASTASGTLPGSESPSSSRSTAARPRQRRSPTTWWRSSVTRSTRLGKLIIRMLQMRAHPAFMDQSVRYELSTQVETATGTAMCNADAAPWVPVTALTQPGVVDRLFDVLKLVTSMADGTEIAQSAATQ